MIEVQFSNTSKIYFLPETWEELTSNDLIQFVKILHENDDPNKAKLLILKQWLKAPDKVIFDTKELDFLSEEIAVKLFPTIDYFLESECFHKNIIPEFRHNGKLYVGPSDMYENMSADELDKADHFFNLYNETKEVDYLINFVASMYRPLDPKSIPGAIDYTGDQRVPFNDFNIKKWGEELKNMDIYTALAILFNYSNVLKWYTTQEQWASAFKGSQSTSAGWEEVIFALSGDKLGTIEQVKRMPIHSVFSHLSYLENQRIELESKNK